MAKSNLLAKLAYDHFEAKQLAHRQTIAEEMEWFMIYILAPMVNRDGQAKTAAHYGVGQSVISKWLKSYGYVARIIWQQAATAQEKADIDAAAARVNAKRRAEGRPTLDEEEE